MYDYVIVGAGSAGCVLAGRLTEDPETKVLLLEAGGRDDADEVHIPLAFSQLFRTRHDWAYTTVEQKHAHGRCLYWPRGKLLGGSSSINAMIYIRGNPLDYDSWRDDYGCAGWGYADLLPYFRRSEDQARGASAFHGVGGPLRVEDPRHLHRLSRSFLTAGADWGLAPVEDFNGAAQEGIGAYQLTMRAGRRWSAADAYLHPALGRPNLTLHTDALVTRIVVEHGRAVSVAYRRHGEEVSARAGAEVLLAGGAVNSPQLLMLSGIGPAAHLAEHAIEVAVDLPGVGANLQDHPIVPVLWFTRGIDRDLNDYGLRDLLRWRLTHRGMLTSNVAEAGAFFRSRAGLPAPDLQLHVAPAAFLDHGLSEPLGHGFTMGPTLISVASRGSLRLRSADPRWQPAIDPAYLSESADVDALVAGIEAARGIAALPALARHLSREHLPGPDCSSADALRDYVRGNVETLYHPVSTCAMGTGELAVVDPQLRVYGVDGLRVVDASVMPAAPRGNTNAPTIALTERAADLIRDRPPLSPEPAGRQYR
ncbi:MAG: GMC family oxidoreductase N-terminal domain-containing protein [Actinomycetota bacterium]|nr:GMC family oxidoreductase N-terminal domain-containing protein [Actinomycetota bacterium]